LKEGIVLLAHGSRERDWARPFEELAAVLARKLEARVALAYLEAMTPSLEDALRQLHDEGVTGVRVVPVFLGQGGHMKDDVPRLLAAARARLHGMNITLDAPIGEQASVIEAIASAIARRR